MIQRLQDRTRAYVKLAHTIICEFRTYIYIELRPASMIPKSLSLTLHMSHRSLSETISNRPAHDTQSLDMGCKLGKRSEQQRYIRQGPRSHHPGRSRRLFHKGMPHGEDCVWPSHRLGSGIGHTCCSVKTSAPCSSSANGPAETTSENIPCILGACTAFRQNGLAAPGCTGTSALPIAVRILKLLVVVRAREALPCTVLTPRRFKAGWWAARRIAKAS